MAQRRKESEQAILKGKETIQQVDSVLHDLLDDQEATTVGNSRNTELNKVHRMFDDMTRDDTFNVMSSKQSNQNIYDYLVSVLTNERNIENQAIRLGIDTKNKPLTDEQKNLIRRTQLESIFSTNDMNAAAVFMNGSSDVMHICDEVESVCAYMYQLDEAVNVLRDNILNVEQNVRDLPFDILLDTTDDRAPQYIKTIKDAVFDTKYIRKLNDHICPKTIKFGRYYHMIIPFTEIGTKMLSSKANRTHSLFSMPMMESTPQGTMESVYVENVTQFESVMESCEKLLTASYNSESSMMETVRAFGLKDNFTQQVKENLRSILVSDEDTPPNITGITEATFEGMTDDLKNIATQAIQRNNTLFNAGLNKGFNFKKMKDEDKHFSDSTIDTAAMANIPGCFERLVDPRQLVPIKIFDFVLGYYYFENYDYARMGTSITDILSNQINFQDHNLLVDNIVTGVLKNLKYGDLLKGDNNFKAMVLNCIFYVERRSNPIRIKFVPTEYVVEYKTNCDQDDNGQPVLLRSLIFGRLYTSLLLFNMTALLTKSLDSEFYYLKESALSQSYEDQVADIIEQFRNANIDISQVLSGDLMHGNRAINKRYFMSVGTQDIKPFDIEVVSGQNIDLHTDFMNELKKMTISSTGVPSTSIDYVDEPEYATQIKMANIKTMRRSNNIQVDLNPSITDSVRKIVKYNKPGIIPDDILESMRCVLRPNNTINNNISSDEINNVQATVDSMIETYFKGQETETPDDDKFIKEEIRKRLIMKLSTSLPWGEIDNMIEDAVISAKVSQVKNQVKSNIAGGSEE